MKSAPFPDDEAQRLQAVQKFELLDTLPEAEFDDLTQLASHICGTPIALMSILDTERQWFKSRVGLEATETPRSISFCGHAILGDTIFEVPDALSDARFADNPLVIGAPDIRFYAGAPLAAIDGFRLGTLCVIDTVPRVLTPAQRSALAALGRQVSRQIENRARLREITEKTEFKDAVLNSADVAIITIALDGTLSSFNRGAEDMLGWRAAALVGRSMPARLFEAVPVAADIPSGIAATPAWPGASTLLDWAASAVPPRLQWSLLQQDGRRVPVEVTLSPIIGDGEQVRGCLCIARDVTQQRQAEAERAAAQELITRIAERVPGMLYQYLLRADGSSHFPYASEGIREIYRLTPQQVRHDAAAVFATIAEEDRKRIAQSVQASAESLSLWREEYRVRHADGTVRWLLGNAQPQRQADGAVLWHGFTSDITDSKTAELALRSNQLFLKTLIDALPVAIFSKYLQGPQAGQILIWNRACETMSGYRAADVIGRTNRQFLPPDQAAMYDAHDQMLLQDRTPITIPFHKVTALNGTQRYARTTSIPLFDQDCGVEFMLGISEDITTATLQTFELKKKQAELQGVNDASPLGMFRTDTQNGFTYVNRKYEVITGLSADKAAGMGWLSGLHPDDRSRALGAAGQAASRQAEYTNFQRFIRSDGSTVLCKVMAAPVLVDGQFTGFVGTIDDITDRRRISDALAESETRLRLITDNLPVLITYIDRERRFKFANATIESWMGMSAASVQDRSFDEVSGPEITRDRREYMDRALAGERVEFEICSEAMGVKRFLHSVYIPDIAPNGSVNGFYTLTSDVSKIKESEQRLAIMARFDHLTGLPNRFQLQEKMLEAIARAKRTKSSMAVMYLDIDRFKGINDSLGHAAGDAVLVEFGQRLKASVRETDTVARLAGDEFVIVLEGLQSAGEPRLVGAKILAAMAVPCTVGNTRLQITTSIGIAYAHTNNMTPDELLALADKSLYQAKKAGRNNFKLA